MAIRNILGALGGLLNRRPDEEDPLAGLSPEALAGYYGARSRGQANDRLNPSDLDLTGPLTGGGQMSAQGAIDAAQRSAERQRNQRKRLDDERMAQRLSERQREEDRRIDSKRKFDESRRDLARNKSRQEQEARMSRQNLRDAQSGAESDFQDRESRDRILEGIMQDRAEVQAQEQADQDLIDANRQASEQRRAEGQFGQDVRRHFGTMSRMGADRENARLAEMSKQGMGRSVDRMKDMADQARMKRLEGIAQERSADALSNMSPMVGQGTPSLVTDPVLRQGLSRKPQIGSFNLDVNRQLNQQFPPTPEEAVEEELKKTSPTASVEPPVESAVEPTTEPTFNEDAVMTIDSGRRGMPGSLSAESIADFPGASDLEMNRAVGKKMLPSEPNTGMRDFEREGERATESAILRGDKDALTRKIIEDSQPGGSAAVYSDAANEAIAEAMENDPSYQSSVIARGGDRTYGSGRSRSRFGGNAQEEEPVVKTPLLGPGVRSRRKRGDVFEPAQEIITPTETPTERTPTFFEEGPEIKITSSEELGDSFDEEFDETKTSGTANFRGNRNVPFGDISGRPDPSVLSAENYYDSLGPSNEPGELGSYRTLGDAPKTVTDVTAPDMETPVAEEEKEQSFFGKIGQLVKDNPEVAAQIAQLGGGLISGAAQGKAQREADAETQRRLGRANMIGAFTGKTPSVQAATADPSGFFSLDTLGKAISGGGAIAQDEIARGKAEKELQRKADLEQQESARKDFEAESRNSWEIERNRIAALDQESQAEDRITRGQNASRELDINEQKYKNDDKYNTEKNNLTKLGYGLEYLKELRAGQQKDMLPEKLQEQYIKKIGIADMLDDVEELTNAAGFGQAGTSLTMLKWSGLQQLPQFMGGKSTTLLNQAVNRLVQTLGQEMSGVLSNQDIEFIKQYTPSADDRADVALEKIRKLRNELAKSSRTAFDVHSAYFHTSGVEPQMRRLMRLNEDSDAKSEEQLNTAIDQYAKTGGS